MVDDAELLRRYAEEKSEAAFAELVSRHLDLVYSAALRRLAGDAHAAADITQQVFTALARQASSLARCAVLPGWLYATTRNVAVDFIRAEKRRRTREQEVHTMQNIFAATPDVDWERLRSVLDEVMDEMSDADREVVVLRYFVKRSFAQIGAALHLTDDAARMRTERALEKLHALLARRGITSTATALGVALANQAAASAPAGMAASVTSAALASAVASTASVLGILQFMSTTKFAAGATTILLLLALGTSVHEVRARHAAEAALESANRDVAAQTVQLSGLNQRAEIAERATQQLKVQNDTARVAQEKAALPT